ncbi:MAG TPA: hypothetical protein VEA63_07435 [Opitutus sp.]|nr:hypothetical protein [Opitutus sp.]
MSAAAELRDVLHDARPKTLRPIVRTTVLRAPHLEVGDISTRVESLCGQVDCRRCEQPRQQQLVARTSLGAETWDVLPCQCGQPLITLGDFIRERGLAG